jgi:hypothetical protein
MKNSLQTPKEHSHYLVDIVDRSGRSVGTKKRAEVDKHQDLYNTVFVVTRCAGTIAMAHIPERTDLPNIYSGTWGATAATIRRHLETPTQAARRCVSSELHIDDATGLQSLGETFVALPHNRHTVMSAYLLDTAMPVTADGLNTQAITHMSPREVSQQLLDTPEQFAPTFQVLWSLHGRELAGA